jgi:hypothetical protein
LNRFPVPESRYLFSTPFGGLPIICEHLLPQLLERSIVVVPYVPERLAQSFGGFGQCVALEKM